VIYTLLDSQGKAGYVGVRRADEKPPRWTLIWNNCQAIGSSSKLVEWFNSLPAPPAEEVVLGKAARLTRVEAEAIARSLVDLLRPIVMPPRPFERRPVARFEKDGAMTWWPSIEAAARGLGTTRFIIDGRLRRGRMLRVP
jgi:hypothetical protein